MRIFLAAIAVGLSWGVGRALAGGLKRRARVIMAIMDAMQILRIHMLDRLLPLRAALEQSRFPPFRALGENLGREGIEGAWKTSSGEWLRHGGAMDSLGSEEIAILNRFFQELGAGGRREQEELFSQALRDLGRLEEEAGKDSRDKAKLYGTLGMLFGLALAIGFF